MISLSWREIVGWGRPPLSRITTTGQNNDVGDYYDLLHTKAGVINSLLKSVRIISNCSLPAPKLHHVSHTLQLLRRKKRKQGAWERESHRTLIGKKMDG